MKPWMVVVAHETEGEEEDSHPLVSTFYTVQEAQGCYATLMPPKGYTKYLCQVQLQRPINEHTD
jgi:hypothetical protein